METISLKSPKRIDNAEWASIQGSALHEKMFRNRFIVNLPNSDAFYGFSVIVEEWLDNHCNSFHHSTSDGTRALRFYIEADVDAVNFKLTFEGLDVSKFSRFYTQATELRRMRFPDFDEERARQTALTRLKESVLAK